MTLAKKRLWEILRIMPEKWSYKPKPFLDGEAWVVGIVGNRVIWYDDYFGEMDDGFCFSRYEHLGAITPRGEIGDDLEKVVEFLRLKITDPSFG